MVAEVEWDRFRWERCVETGIADGVLAVVGLECWLLLVLNIVDVGSVALLLYSKSVGQDTRSEQLRHGPMLAIVAYVELHEHKAGASRSMVIVLLSAGSRNQSRGKLVASPEPTSSPGIPVWHQHVAHFHYTIPDDREQMIFDHVAITVIRLTSCAH